MQALHTKLRTISLLGDFVPLLAALQRIFSIPTAAQALTGSPAWLPQLKTGREAEVCSCPPGM